MNENLSVVDELGEAVGSLWADLQNSTVQSGERFTYAAPLSTTPIPIYNWVLNNHERFDGWGQTQFVLMDEQVDGSPSAGVSYIDSEDEASYERFAEGRFIGPLRRAAKCPDLSILKPDLSRLEVCHIPPIDMLILALGVDGNYANVMPGTAFDTGWHIAALTTEFTTSHTSSVHSSYRDAQFRQYGMSLGPQQVLKARQIIVVASGQRKRELLSRLLSLVNFDPDFPISIIYSAAIRGRVSIFVTEDTL